MDKRRIFQITLNSIDKL